MGECANIPELLEGQTYHAFIIHNSETEREVSLQLYEDLEKKGYKCCHADLDFQPGTRVVANIMNTINVSRRVIAIVSPQFLKSSWCNLEMVTTINLSYDRDRQLLIPILYNINPDTDWLPTEIKSMTYLEYKDTHFWKKLTDALVMDVPLAASIPAGNVAHGLAWSYFYGFLNLVLPKLGERVKSWDYWDKHPEDWTQTGQLQTGQLQTGQLQTGQLQTGQSNRSFILTRLFGLAWSYFYGFLNLILPRKDGQKTVGHPRILPKLIIVSPQSCQCPNSFTEVDENIVHVGHIPFKASRAGNIDRDYKNSVYKVTDPETLEVYYAILEFATPILSLYEMEQGAIAGLNTIQKDAQRQIFEAKLEEILEHTSNRQCRGQAILLSYRDKPTYGDDTGREVTRLSTVVVSRIRHELDKQTKAAALQPQMEDTSETLGQLQLGE